VAKQVEDIVVRLVGEGFEALDKIKGSFRELGKVTNLAEKDILSARDSLLDYARKAGNTEAVNKGLGDAFKGLRSQVDLCSDAYRVLSADLRQIDEVSRGATQSVMAQRQAVLASTAAGTQNVAALQQQRAALIALRAQTRDASTAFDQFSADIQAVETRLTNLADVNNRLNSALSRARAGTAAGARAELEVIERGISLRREEINDIDLLNKKQRNTPEILRQRLELENQLNTALAARRQIQFQETARTGRESVRTGAATFNSADLTGTGYLTAGRISGRLGELPDTTAGLSQELGELNERLINTYRNTETYIAVQLRLAAVQRDVTSATQGFGAALLADLNAGTLIPSQKNLAEVIGQLRREMLELDQTTTEGSRAYAQNAAEVDRLQQQLDKLAGAYRSVSAASRGATSQGTSRVTVGGERPFVSEMDRQKERRDAAIGQREEFERLTTAANASDLDAVDALLSAKRTLAEHEVNAAQKLDQLKDDLHAKDIQRVDELFKKEVDAFNRRLQLDTRAQQVAATKQEMGFFAQSELSPFYGSIAEMGGTGAARQQRFMGRNPAQVLDDIATSFGAGGRTPPVPPSAGGGPSPATNTEFTKLNATLTKFGALNRRSVTDIRQLGSVLDELRNDLSPLDAEYRQVNKSIEAQQTLIERELGRRERRQRRAPSTGQLVQAGGAAISGGIFGGPEGFLGGVAGGVLGTVLPGIGTAGGAFAGAAFGAQAGMFRQQLGGTAEYAASIGKLQIALRGVVGSQEAYDAAIRAAAAATRDLNIPQEEATRGLTRLSAAVIGAGGTVADSSFAFRAMSEAIKATGGNAEQVDGALLALTQVFSKGKVSAEELNQIAERLPGTFTLFAKAAGKTGPELQKALEQGQVGLNDLMKFLELTGERYGKIALDISGSSQDAGARLTVAFQAMRLEVGNALQPLGAELQGAFATFIKDITPAVVGSAKAIAAVLSFLTTNDLVAFGVQLTAVSLGFKGLQVAVAALTSLNVASWFTATAVGAKVTSSGMAAATVTTGGLTGAIKALTLAMAKNPLTLLILAGTAAAIAIGNAVIEQKKLNDEVQKSLDIAAKAPASDVAKEINATENALRKERSKIADALKNPGFEAARLIPNAEVERLEAKLVKLNKIYKVRIELETIFKGLGAIPEGYKVVNGRLAYLSPGQGYIDAETGKPVAKGRSTFPGGGGEDGGEKAGASLLRAIEQRETALLNLRTQREEQLAQIREQAVEQARQIETQLADKRLAIERQIADITQQRSDSAEDSARRIREARGEDSDLIAAEQKVVDIFREERDAKLDSERRLADDKKQQEETIAEFQRGVAKSINDANRAHTRSMGEIQKQYANSVAKIIDEGTGKAGKRLEKAAQLAAIYIQRGVLNNEIGAATGLVIPERVNGRYDFAKVGSAGVAGAEDIKKAPRFQDVKLPLDTLLKLDETIESLRKGLSTRRTPGIGDQFTALLGAEGGFEDVAMTRGQAALIIKKLEAAALQRNITPDAFAVALQQIGDFAQSPDASRRTIRNLMATPGAGIAVRSPGLLRNLATRQLSQDQANIQASGVNPATLTKQIEPLLAIISQLQKDNLLRKDVTLSETKEEIQKPIYGALMDWLKANLNNTQLQEILKRSLFGANAETYGAKGLLPLAAGFKPASFGVGLTPAAQKDQREYEERMRYEATPAGRAEKAAEEEYARKFREGMRMKFGPRSDADVPGIQDGIEGASLLGTGFDVSKIATDFGQIASASFIGGLLAQNSPIPESQKLRDSQGRELNRGQPTAYPIPAIPSAEATTQLRNTQAQTEEQARQAKTAQLIEEAFADVNREGAQFTNGLNEQLQLLEDQRKFLDMGFSDALSSDLANLDRGLNSSEAVLRRITDQLKVQGVDAATAEAAYDKELANLAKVYTLNVQVTQELEKQAQALRIRQDERIGLGMQEGVQSYLESIGTMRQATEELTVNGIKGVENAIFDLVTTGKTNFREFAADILRQTARMIIQQLVLRNVMLIVKSAFGFADGGVFGGGSSGGYYNPMTGVGTAGPNFGFAMGGTFAKNNIIPYAKGGTFTNSVVSKPTLFKFAAGGTMQTGVMGEAGPEAIMPLSRGANGKLGVSSSGGGTTNVTVNVDASGSKAQGDSGKGEQLGRAVSQAVQDELLKQRRPGGLLA
jgi:lambda family phage tail tape measure protein